MKSGCGLARVLVVFTAIGTISVSAVAQLDPPPVPPENRITPEKTVLGKILFWEEQMSSDNTIACGTCHQPRQGGADPRFTRQPTGGDRYGSPGVRLSDVLGRYEPSGDYGFDPQLTFRLSQPYIGAGYFKTNFWDGRAPTTFIDPVTGLQSIATGGALESQLVVPPVSPVEMAHPGRTWVDIEKKLVKARPLVLASDLPTDVADALALYPTYPDLFRHAFGDSTITTERIAFAIATYERSLVPDQTPWDYYARGVPDALTPGQLRGLNLFMGKARCHFCHIPPLFADDDFHNIGVRPPGEDRGLQNVTGKYSDRGKFKTPTLRNTGLRRRWMHNGRFGDLNHVMEFYIRGADFTDNLDPLIIPLNLNTHEKFDVYDFITNAVTDPNVQSEIGAFTRPRLRSESPTNPRLYGDSSVGTGGFTPLMLAETPPTLGNDFFKLAVYEALGGSFAMLGIAADAAPPGLVIDQVPVNISPAPQPYLLPVNLAGAGPGGGYATQILNLSKRPALTGQTWYTQWFIADPAAPGGIAASVGAEFTIY